MFCDEFSQPDANDGEPDFSSASGGQAFTIDEGVQPTCLRATPRQTRQVAPNENSPLDREQPEVRLFAACLPRLTYEDSPARRRNRASR
jgi:hypothetical protein